MNHLLPKHIIAYTHAGQALHCSRACCDDGIAVESAVCEHSTCLDATRYTLPAKLHDDITMIKLELQDGIHVVLRRQSCKGLLELVHHQVMISHIFAVHERHQKKL